MRRRRHGYADNGPAVRGGDLPRPLRTGVLNLGPQISGEAMMALTGSSRRNHRAEHHHGDQGDPGLPQDRRAVPPVRPGGDVTGQKTRRADQSRRCLRPCSGRDTLSVLHADQEAVGHLAARRPHRRPRPEPVPNIRRRPAPSIDSRAGPALRTMPDIAPGAAWAAPKTTLNGKSRDAKPG